MGHPARTCGLWRAFAVAVMVGVGGAVAHAQNPIVVSRIYIGTATIDDSGTAIVLSNATVAGGLAVGGGTPSDKGIMIPTGTPADTTTNFHNRSGVLYWGASPLVATTATNLAGGVAGSLPYQSAADTTTFLAIGSQYKVLESTGSAPQWVSSLTNVSVTGTGTWNAGAVTVSGLGVFDGASIYRNATNDVFSVYGSSAGAGGSWISIFGNTHATTPDIITLNTGTAERLRILADGTIRTADASAFQFGSTISLVRVADNRLGLADGDSLESTYTSGWAGSGYTLNYNQSYPSQSFLQVDRLSVRGIMDVYELLVHQIRATNGSIFVANTGKVASVVDNSGGSYTITTETEHGFAAGDLIRAQRFTGTGVYQSDMTVASVGSDTVFAAALRATYDAPAAGMEFVRIGNTSDADRQGSIYLTADDTNAPHINILSGVAAFTDWGAAAKTKVRIGNLNGICGYSTNVFGLCAGVSEGASITVDGTNGVRIQSAAATGARVSLDTTGLKGYDAGPTLRFSVLTDGSGTLGTNGIAWTTAGVVTAAGWVLTATSFADAAGVVGLSSAVTGGDDIRFWAGDATPGSAEFRVTEAGALTASNATITSASGTVVIGASGIAITAPTTEWTASGSYRFTPVSFAGDKYGMTAFEQGGGLNDRYLMLDNIVTGDYRAATWMRVDNSVTSEVSIKLTAWETGATLETKTQAEITADYITLTGPVSASSTFVASSTITGSGFIAGASNGLTRTCNPTAGNIAFVGGIMTSCTAADPEPDALSEVAALRLEVAQLRALVMTLGTKGVWQ
jgi:hypothetical protein